MYATKPQTIGPMQPQERKNNDRLRRGSWATPRNSVGITLLELPFQRRILLLQHLLLKAFAEFGSRS